MNSLIYYLCLSFLSSWIRSENVYFKKEKMRHRHSYLMKGKVAQNHLHEVVFHIKQLNLSYLQQVVSERSSPGDPMYQEWLSFAEVGELTANIDSANKVLEYLSTHGIKVNEKSFL